MSIAHNKNVTHRVVDELINEGRMGVADELLSPDYILYFPGEPEPIARAQLGDFLRKLRTAFPDLWIHMEDMVADEDKVAILVTWSGTHRGPFQGFEATGRSMKVKGQLFYRLKDGKVVEARPTFDRYAMFEQLGIVLGQSAEAR
jgi:steroid delta-isomerase-like uncharacterized protein